MGPPLLLLAALLAAATPALAVNGNTPILVPANDVPLATLMLIGAGRSTPVLLFDPQDQTATANLLAATGGRADCVARAAMDATARSLLESTAGASCRSVEDLTALARSLWPSPSRAVLAPAEKYTSLLRAAAFAGAIDAALVPVEASHPPRAADLEGWVSDMLYVLPGAEAVVPPGWPPDRVMRLAKSDVIVAELLRRLPAPPRTVVVANPKDREGRFSPSALSLLAPLVSAAHRAPLILATDPAPDAVEAAVGRFLTTHAITPTHIYLVGDELALRSHRVPDPVLRGGGPAPIGGGTEVRVELFSEIQRERPQGYAVGRLVAVGVAQGSALLARQLHDAISSEPRHLVFLSNADEIFALGETISRTTVGDLRNRGYKVRARYRDKVTPDAIRAALEEADLLVWEGHARDLTLEERGGIAVDRAPPLVVLQGCYTLDRSDPFILFERGTEAVVATSAAIYSASGSAFARAFFDALGAGGADLGLAVRDARNYLLAVSELKKQRGHKDWTKTYRAALAFALWGDPTARPLPTAGTEKLPGAAWSTDDHSLRLSIPKRPLEAATVGRYSAQPVPRAMLSGLILREGSKPEREVKSLFFTAQQVPPGITAACPPAPGWELVSLFAPQTSTLSVLARPPGDSIGSGVPAGDFKLRLAADLADCKAKD